MKLVSWSVLANRQPKKSSKCQCKISSIKSLNHGQLEKQNESDRLIIYLDKSYEIESNKKPYG